MKYASEITINRDLETVVKLFDDPKNLLLWMEGLQSFEPIEGIPGEPGAKSRLLFKMGKREVVMIETVVSRNLPHEFSGTYEADGVFNEVSNHFERISDTKTKYTSVTTFHFKGFFKIVAFLMPGIFKKQTLKYLNDFKKFAENQP